MKINQVINDDCLNYMRGLPDKCIDLCLTDPPYGIKADKNLRANTKYGASKAICKDYGSGEWDNFIPTIEYFDEMFRISKNQIIWGGNYFIEFLNNTSCFVVWDKNNGSNGYADFEMAWTSFKSASRLFKFTWHGMIQENMKNKEIRIHPTQKPVELFSWILENYSKEGDIIFDPFASSGTTAISCINMNRKYILVEKEKEYFDIINKRIERHLDGNLFAMES